MPVLLNNICPGKHHPGYGISSGKLWKLRAAVNYALAAGKLVQVQCFLFLFSHWNGYVREQLLYSAK